MRDDDRPKKSWREIDKTRDRSTHRRDDRPGGGLKPRGPRSQKSYRAALDRLFDSGKIGDLVEEKAPSSGDAPAEGGENRFKALRKIKEAVGRDAITKAADAYFKHFELPDDLEALGQLLEHRDEGRQLEAMERIAALLEQGEKPRRSRAMVGQLKLIRDLSGDPRLEKLAGRLLDLL